MNEPYVIVTGGAVDEGLSTAESLLNAGIRVSIWDDDAAQLEHARAELTNAGPEFDLRKVDVGNEASVEKTYASVRAAFGVPAGLFTMAVLRRTYMLGGSSDKQPEVDVPFWELDRSRARRVIEVNALGTFFCSAMVAPDMIKEGRGSIVLFSTGLETQRSSNIPYGPSRALVEAFAVGAARQLEPYNVRLNVLASGGRVNRREQNDPRYEPADWMSKLAPYLASNDSLGVTGKIFRSGSLTPSPD